jgi:acylphosphatase
VRVARRYVIGGRVQGVGFRYFALDAAAREGITGWVRNLANGGVEIVAEGEAEAIARFEHAVRHGPSHARVEEFDATDRAPSGASGFTIR